VVDSAEPECRPKIDTPYKISDLREPVRDGQRRYDVRRCYNRDHRRHCFRRHRRDDYHHLRLGDDRLGTMEPFRHRF